MVFPKTGTQMGNYGPERYVEAHVWSDRGIKKMAKDKDLLKYENADK